jgi:hypothetical protein
MAGWNVDRRVVSLGAILLLAGCTGSGPHQSARVLQHRLQANLAPEISSRQASIQKLPDGARVTLSDAALFAPGQSDLDTSGRFTIASLAESLLDPRLMQVDVAGPASVPAGVQQAKAQSITAYLQDYVAAPPLPVAAVPPSAGPATQAATITIRVHCPPGPQGSTWGYAIRGATCD